MSMNLHVHSMHKIEHQEVGVSGWDDCENFMSRLTDYCNELGATCPNETGWGEGWATWEIPVESLEELLEQEDSFFTEEVDDGNLEDKEIIQTLYDRADKDGNGYIYIEAY